MNPSMNQTNYIKWKLLYQRDSVVVLLRSRGTLQVVAAALLLISHKNDDNF